MSARAGRPLRLPRRRPVTMVRVQVAPDRAGRRLQAVSGQQSPIAWSRCARLVSINTTPPGSSHPMAPTATRRSTARPSAPPSSAARGSWQPGLRRHQGQLRGGHVGHVGHQHVDPAAQLRREGVEQVALVHPRAAAGGEVRAGAAHRGRIDVRRVQPDRRYAGRDGGADRAGAAAQVDDDRGPARLLDRPGGRVDEQLAARSRHEDASATVTRTPQKSAQPTTCSSGRPAARRATIAASAPGSRGGGQQHVGLLLGEHAAGGAQAGGDLGSAEAGHDDDSAAS